MTVILKQKISLLICFQTFCNKLDDGHVYIAAKEDISDLTQLTSKPAKELRHLTVMAGKALENQ